MEKIKLENIRISIIGAAKSGIGAARLLSRHGASVFLSESQPKDKLKFFDEKEMKKFGIRFELGGNSDEIYNADFMVLSPGISVKTPLVRKALEKNIKVVSEIEAASWFCPCPVISVTGTNGKTTTTELLGAILRDAGFDAKVCGNVGIAFSDVVESLKPESVVVLETSSFQLDTIRSFKPKIAVILNITPDHIDWHGDFENYRDAKFKINVNQDSSDFIILNGDDANIVKCACILNGSICVFSLNNNVRIKNHRIICTVNDSGYIVYKDREIDFESEIIDKNGIYLRGKHNLCNSLAAVTASKIIGVGNESLASTLGSFRGVPHRIEFVREYKGVKYYNDSKATNFDSLYVALESFESGIVLMMGGKKGDNNFEAIEKLVSERVREIVAVGQSSPCIQEYFSAKKKVTVCKTLEEAVKKAGSVSAEGDVVLYSPGYKSFDMFENFEHRGDEFKRIVNSLS